MPSKSKRRKPYNIPNIHDSIRADYKSGAMTLLECATEWHKAGYTPVVNLEWTRQKLGISQ